MSKRIAYSLRLAVSLGLLTWLATKIELTQSVQVLAGVDPFSIVLALLITQITFAVSAYRWRILLSCNNTEVPFNTLNRIGYVTGFLGMFVPGAISVDAMRVAGLARHTSDLATSLSSVLVDRLFGMIAMALIVLLGLALSPLSVDRIIAVWAGLMAGGGILALLLVLTGSWYRSLISKLIPPALHRYVIPRLEKIYVCLDQYRENFGTMVSSFVWSLAVNLLRIALVLIVAWGLALKAPLFILLVLVPVVTIVELLPISVGGLGVRETGYIYFLGLAGVPSEQAFALSILLYGLHLISILPGAFFLFCTPKVTNANGKV